MEFSSEIGAVQRRMAQTQEGVGRRKATFEALNVAVGQQILDVGCGGGHLLKDLALSVGTGGRVVGLDPSDQQIAAATDYCQGLDNVTLSKDSATALSFTDGEFDGIASIQVLEYIDDVDSAIAEIRRVLKPGGRLSTVSVLWDRCPLQFVLVVLSCCWGSSWVHLSFDPGQIALSRFCWFARSCCY